jgi:DNA topoisomerase-2
MSDSEAELMADDSEFEDKPVAAKKAKVGGAAAAGQKGRKPAASAPQGKKQKSDHTPSKKAAAGESPAAIALGRTSTQKKELAKTFQKKTQLEHILLRPDTYIGSVERVTQKMWVKDPGVDTLVERDMSFVPGSCKVIVGSGG